MRPATTAADGAHRTTAELEAGLVQVRRSPADGGRLELVVRRPAVGQREELDEGQLDLHEGLVGDTWSVRPSRRTDDGGPHAEMQLNVMNSRMAALVAGDPARRGLAGDQLYVDLDISEENLPAGMRLVIGSAVIEVTTRPHLGCDKFVARFGMEAMRLVNSPAGRALRLRGLNARVVQPGTIRPGDTVRKAAP
jgi:MOSC domain-containing protein YiiM